VSHSSQKIARFQPPRQASERIPHVPNACITSGAGPDGPSAVRAAGGPHRLVNAVVMGRSQLTACHRSEGFFRRCAFTQIEVDERLVGNTGLLCQALEVLNGACVQANRDLALQPAA